MSSRTLIIVGVALGVAPLASAAEAKVNYQDHVSKIFQNRCNSCHNADKQKGGLNLETFGTAMQGGGSGKVIEPGDLASSTLWQLVTHAEQPNMPPNQPKLPDAELDVVRQWIEGGAPESSGSALTAQAKPKFEFKLDPSAIGKPSGDPAMPSGVLTEPLVVAARPNAITALASSPWAPLVAVAGHKQVFLYHTGTYKLVGVLPFPEGTVHVLKFSRNGDLLLAGGGRGGQSGRVVVWDVKTGKRAFEVGKEYDAVLAADISPDHSQVALGGPSKIVRVYATADGSLMYEEKKHTEWITALEFSPDGVLLASGDRNSGLFVWEAVTGREFFELRGHTLAITDISWRLDSNVVASASEDGSIRLWEMENGGQIKTWNSHGGVASTRFAKDGRLVTSGRDHVVRLWDPNGNLQREFNGAEAFPDLALEAVFTHDEAAIVAGDWSGEVRVWDAKDGKRLANLSANPPTLAARLDQASQALSVARANAEVAAAELSALQNAATEKANLQAKAQQALTEAEALAAQRNVDVANLEKALAEKVAAEKANADALGVAQAESTRRVAAKAEADRIAAEKAAVARSSAETFAATKTDLDKTLMEKAAADAALAVKAAEAALAPIAPAADLAKATQAAFDKATAEKAAVAKPLDEARVVAQTTSAAVPSRKAELDAANAARAAADKAVVDKTPAVQALAAQANALKAEVDALAAEKQSADAAKAATATASAAKP